MITYFLGHEEVSGYTRDLANRLALLGDQAPTIWCPLGNSGDHLVRKIAPHVPKSMSASVGIVPLAYHKQHAEITCLGIDEDQIHQTFKDKYVLVLDSSVHSGSSMRAASEYVLQQGALGVLTYTLVVKKGAAFIPHLFGVVVGDHDRALFMLDVIPNNRLFNRNRRPVGLLRQLIESDCQRTPASLKCGVESIDKVTWGDLWYEHKVHGYQVYVIEDRNRLAGFIKLKFEAGGKLLFVDIIAVDKIYQGQKLAGALMRWAETLGRSSKAQSIELWSIVPMTGMYEKLGFELTGESLDLGGGEVYSKMRRRLLYHFDLPTLSD